MNNHKIIVAIADNDVWEQALSKGHYTQSTVDSTIQEVGFIHCSFPNQTFDIAKRHFKNRDNLILLLIDTEKITSPVKFEKALSGRDGIFPHIYGPLNVDAVYQTVSLEMDSEGNFIEPKEIKELKQQFST